MATNACLDELRRRRRRPRPTDDDTMASRADPRSESRVADTVSARLDVDAALAELPEDYRAAVALRDLAGLDYAAIAEILDVPPGTVRSRIARGRAALADRLAVPADPPTGNPARSSTRPRGEDQ